jgi:hypothetical protein
VSRLRVHFADQRADHGLFFLYPLVHIVCSPSDLSNTKSAHRPYPLILTQLSHHALCTMHDSALLIRYAAISSTASHIVPCAPQLSALLACFASSADMRGTEACASAAQTLSHCMATNKMVAKPPKPQVSLIIIAPRVLRQGGEES